MCKFCNAKDNGKGSICSDEPLFDRRESTGLFGEITFFGMIEYRDNEDILYIAMNAPNGIVEDKKYIKYCPICGRNLEEVEATNELSI